MRRPVMHLIVLALFVCVALPAGRADAQSPNAWDLIAAVQKEQLRVKDYTASITAIADIPGMQTPEMNATLYYKRPDKVHVESEGFAMIPRDVLTLNASQLRRESYDAVVQGTASVDGVTCTKVKLLALADSLRLQRIVLYVDPGKSVVRKMETDPGTGASAVVTIAYTDVKGYLLPARIVVEMDAPQQFRFPQKGGADAKAAEKKKSRVELRYSGYKVNTGLDDALFTRTSSN